jgi:hypothetical protein
VLSNKWCLSTCRLLCSENPTRSGHHWSVDLCLTGRQTPGAREDCPLSTALGLQGEWNAGSFSIRTNDQWCCTHAILAKPAVAAAPTMRFYQTILCMGLLMCSHFPQPRGEWKEVSSPGPLSQTMGSSQCFWVRAAPHSCFDEAIGDPNCLSHAYGRYMSAA